VNKIAAGEVVERPASVVKELVENSLDAGSDLIEVEIKDAGRNLIRVVDNGRGMSREDALLCTSAHATSKISTAQDLEKISTLGFRGEALSSIASVSLMHIVSRTQSMDSAVELEIEAGEIKSTKEIGSPKGTMVEVRNLFFNTPARKKFLKSPATEMTHIIHIMEQFSLGYPEVQFRLIHQEQELLNLLPITGTPAG
jgi:DNA mismatch repair protein MutL